MKVKRGDCPGRTAHRPPHAWPGGTAEVCTPSKTSGPVGRVPGPGSIHIRSIPVSRRPRKNGKNGKNEEKWGKMGKNGEKWGKMGENGGKWGKMGENGKLLQIHHGKCMKLFHQERKMEENGVEMGGKWVKNGTRAGPIFPIFPKGNLLPHRAVNTKPSTQVSGWENGENGGIWRYPENWILPRLGVPTVCPRRCTVRVCTARACFVAYSSVCLSCPLDDGGCTVRRSLTRRPVGSVTPAQPLYRLTLARGVGGGHDITDRRISTRVPIVPRPPLCPSPPQGRRFPPPAGGTDTTQQWPEFYYTQLKIFFSAFGVCDSRLISYCLWAK